MIFVSLLKDVWSGTDELSMNFVDIYRKKKFIWTNIEQKSISGVNLIMNALEDNCGVRDMDSVVDVLAVKIKLRKKSEKILFVLLFKN